MPTAPANPGTNAMTVLASSCVAMLAVGINGTAVMAALPTMRSELALGPAGIQWTINAYLVVSGACIVMGGAAADRFGARKTAMIGLALFAIASSFIALAGSEQTLLAARALQGIAAAFAVPSTLADVRLTARADRQGAAMGAWTGFLMLGFSVGPLVGGALTHFASWRVIFWLNVALMVAAMAGLGLGGGVARRPDVAPRPTDWPGFALLAAFMVSVVYTLQALPHASASRVEVIGSLMLALATSLGLLNVELRARTPLFDVRFFGNRAFAMGTVIASLSMMSILCLLLYYNLHAQSREGGGLSPLQAGASLWPLCVALLVLALSASRIAARIGVRATVVTGMLLVTAGAAALAATTTENGPVARAIGFLVLGAGLALPYSTGPRLALSALAPTQAGQGSGMVNACTFLGGSIGVAGGAIAFAADGFVAVLAMLALIGMIGAVLGRSIPHDC